MIGSETTESYLARLASREPTPGGGAAGALHAAQGAALVGMVARYSTGPKYAGHEAEASEIIERADKLASVCLTTADDDEAAFAAVIAAYRLPPGEGRTAAIQSALVAATAPPRDLVAHSEAVVSLGERLVAFCNSNVISDVAAAAEAARAAAATARVNLEINLAGIKDPAALAVILRTIESADSVIEQAEALSDRVRKQILA